MGISTLLTELERGEMEEAAEAVGNATAEAEAAAVAASRQAAAAAGAAAAEGKPAEVEEPKVRKKKKKKKAHKAREQVDAAVVADDDLATAPTARRTGAHARTWRSPPHLPRRPPPPCPKRPSRPGNQTGSARVRTGTCYAD